jgi:hypothetical protein
MHINTGTTCQNAGFKDSDIPQDLKEYWAFWRRRAAAGVAPEDRQ